MRRNHGLWIGPLLAGVGLVSYFLYFARFPVLRDFPWVNLPLVLLGVVVSGLAVLRAFKRPSGVGGRVSGVLGLGLSLAVACLFTLYVFHLSSLMPPASATTLGLAEAPDFTLTDQSGRPVRLGDLRGRKVVLTFYRGFW